MISPEFKNWTLEEVETFIQNGEQGYLNFRIDEILNEMSILLEQLLNERNQPK